MAYHDTAMAPTHRPSAAQRWVGALNAAKFAGPESRLFDRVGMTLSGLCLVHCVATTVFVALLSAAGGWLVSPLVHEIGLFIAIGFGAIALWKGIIEHGYLQPAAFGGLGLVALVAGLVFWRSRGRKSSH